MKKHWGKNYNFRWKGTGKTAWHAYLDEEKKHSTF